MNNETVKINDSVEVDVRRPNGTIETFTLMNPIYKDQKVPLRNITPKQIEEMKAATRAAGRGEVIAVRIITRDVVSVGPTAADLEEESEQC